MAEWGSEDELLNENAGGISAFQNQEIDEDALLGSDADEGGEGGHINLDDLNDEELIEVEIEEEEDGDWADNVEQLPVLQEDTDVVHFTEGGMEEPTEETQPIEEPATEYQTQEHETSLTTATVAEESEEEEEDEHPSSRGRFMSERPINTISQRASKQIPENLDSVPPSRHNSAPQNKQFMNSSRGGGGRGGGHHSHRGRGGQQHFSAPNSGHQQQHRPLKQPQSFQPMGVQQQMQMQHGRGGHYMHRPRQQQNNPMPLMQQRQQQPQNVGGQFYYGNQQQQPRPLFQQQPEQMQGHMQQRFPNQVNYNMPQQAPNRNMLEPQQSMDFNHRDNNSGNRINPLLGTSTQSTSIHVNPHFKGNQQMGRRSIEEDFGFPAPSQGRADPVSMLSEAARNQRLQQQQQQNNMQYNQNMNTLHHQGGTSVSSMNHYQDQDMRPLMQNVPQRQPQQPHYQQQQPQQLIQHQQRFQPGSERGAPLLPQPASQQQIPPQQYPQHQNVTPQQPRQQFRPPAPRIQNPPIQRGQPIRTLLHNSGPQRLQVPNQPQQPIRGKSIPTLGSPPSSTPQQQQQPRTNVQNRLGPKRSMSQPNLPQPNQQPIQNKVQVQRTGSVTPVMSRQQSNNMNNPAASGVTKTFNNNQVQQQQPAKSKEELEKMKQMEKRKLRFASTAPVKTGVKKVVSIGGKNTTDLNLPIKRVSTDPGPQEEASPPKQLKLQRTIMNDNAAASKPEPQAEKDVYSSEELYQQKLEEQKRMREELQRRKELNRQKRADSLKQETSKTDTTTAIEDAVTSHQQQHQQQKQQQVVMQRPQKQQQPQQQKAAAGTSAAKPQPLRVQNMQQQVTNNPQGPVMKTKKVTRTWMTPAQLRARGQFRVVSQGGKKGQGQMQQQGQPQVTNNQPKQKQAPQNRQVTQSNRVVLTKGQSLPQQKFQQQQQQPRKVIDTANIPRKVVAPVRTLMYGLPANTPGKKITEMATSCGTVLDIGAHPGRAIVTFDSEQGADAFIKKYNMQMFNLSRIKVQKLQPQQ